MSISLSAPRPIRHLVGAALLLLTIIYLLRKGSGGPSGISGDRPGSLNPASGPRRQFAAHDTDVDLSDKAVVVASIKKADTSWVAGEFDGWKQYIYVADDPSAPLHTAQNKGNEGNVYLTYIIDNYHQLPSTIVFLHHHARSFHVDNAFSTNAQSVRALNLSYVQREGYASLRCMSEMGCICAPMRMWDARDIMLQAAWPTLFPNERLPEMIVAPCCAQFAVSRSQVLSRPVADYQRIHSWLMSTTYVNAISGRILEHIWHIIFGKEAVHCLDEDACYCDKFGLCENPEKQLNNEGKVRGQHPEKLNWLQGHTCAKWPGGVPKKVPWEEKPVIVVPRPAGSPVDKVDEVG